MAATPRIDEVLRYTTGEVLHIGCSGQAGRRSSVDSPFWMHGRLMKKHGDVWGLEYSPSNIAELEAEGIRNIHLGDAQDFDLGRTFDTIVAGELIEHLPNPGAFLNACRKHLGPGGRLVLTTPYAFNMFSSIYAWLKFPHTCSNPEHTTWFCPTTLSQLAVNCGYRVESLTLVRDYRPDLPSRTGRMVGAFARTVGRIFPDRMVGTSMVAVLVPA
jgi:SAM-dependent methyltransferase